MLYEAIQIYCNWIMLWRGWRWTLGSLYSHISLSLVLLLVILEKQLIIVKKCAVRRHCFIILGV
jgi:hypothetical protein